MQAVLASGPIMENPEKLQQVSDWL